MRLKIPSKRHDSALFAHLEERLRTIPKIESAGATSGTASVLLNFVEGQGAGIAVALDALEILSLATNRQSPSATASVASDDSPATSMRRSQAGVSTAAHWLQWC